MGQDFFPGPVVPYRHWDTETKLAFLTTEILLFKMPLWTISLILDVQNLTKHLFSTKLCNFVSVDIFTSNYLISHTSHLFSYFPIKMEKSLNKISVRGQ